MQAAACPAGSAEDGFTGRVFAAGQNTNGQLGDGSQTQRSTLVEATALGNDNALVSAGYSYSLYLKSDGRVFAAGRNHYGELGDGSTTQRNTPVEVTALGNDNALVTAGRFHSVYFKSDGRVFAAGSNSYGQLGDGSTTQRNTPVEVTAL